MFLNWMQFKYGCLTTTKGVYPPSFQGQLISLQLRTIDLFIQKEKTNMGQQDCSEKEKTSLELMAGCYEIKTIYRTQCSQSCSSNGTVHFKLIM